MPVYKYVCSDCKNKFEVTATLEEKEGCCSPKFKCPKCGSKNVKQKFSLATFFKKDKGCGCQDNCCG